MTDGDNLELQDINKSNTAESNYDIELAKLNNIKHDHTIRSIDSDSLKRKKTKSETRSRSKGRRATTSTIESVRNNTLHNSNQKDNLDIDQVSIKSNPAPYPQRNTFTGFTLPSLSYKSRGSKSKKLFDTLRGHSHSDQKDQQLPIKKKKKKKSVWFESTRQNSELRDKVSLINIYLTLLKTEVLMILFYVSFQI